MTSATTPRIRTLGVGRKRRQSAGFPRRGSTDGVGVAGRVGVAVVMSSPQSVFGLHRSGGPRLGSAADLVTLRRATRCSGRSTAPCSSNSFLTSTGMTSTPSSGSLQPLRLDRRGQAQIDEHLLALGEHPVLRTASPRRGAAPTSAARHPGVGRSPAARTAGRPPARPCPRPAGRCSCSSTQPRRYWPAESISPITVWPLTTLAPLAMSAKSLSISASALALLLPVLVQRQVPVVVVDSSIASPPSHFGIGQVLPGLGLLACGHLRGVPAGREQVVAGLPSSSSNRPSSPTMSRRSPV